MTAPYVEDVYVSVKVFVFRVNTEAFARSLIRERVVDDVTLGDLLLKVPAVLDVEYNGHYGPHVFVRVDVSDFTPGSDEEEKTIAECKDLIERYLEERDV